MKKSSNALHPDLLLAQKHIYEPNGLVCSNIQQEAESTEYGAFEFDLNNQHVKFRVAKITPTKVGQFVTLWKRIENGPIQPYDITDPIDLFIISVRNAEHFGQFVFPKAVLLTQGVLAKNGKGGKRALRVYPSWDKTDSPQAKKTQDWQLLYFFEIDFNQGANIEIVKKLYT